MMATGGSCDEAGSHHHAAVWWKTARLLGRSRENTENLTQNAKAPGKLKKGVVMT